MKRNLLAAVAALCLTSAPVWADGYDLTVKSISELPADTSPAAASDMLVRYDASSDRFVKVDADDLSALFGVDSGEAELDSIADNSARVNTITADTTLDCATHGTGQLNFMSAAAGTINIAATLPAATGSGCRYWIGWSAAPNSAAGQPGDVVQVTGNDSFNGAFWMTQDSGNTAVAFETSSDTDKLTFSSTQGAAVANVFIEVIDYAADKYQILDSKLIGTGTEATPGATGQRS